MLSTISGRILISGSGPASLAEFCWKLFSAMIRSHFGSMLAKRPCVRDLLVSSLPVATQAIAHGVGRCESSRFQYHWPGICRTLRHNLKPLGTGCFANPNFAIPSVSNGLNLCRNVRQIPQICWTRDRRAFVDEVHKYDKVVTPYGPLVQDLKLALTDGGMHTAKVLNPFALLWSAAKPSVAQIVGKSHWPPPLYHECDWACGPNFALGYSGVGPLRLPTVCRTFGVVGSSPYRPPWPRASSRCISTASRITRCSTATR